MWKDFSEFNKHSDAKDGLQFRCKECFYSYNSMHAQERKEYRRLYYKKIKMK